MFSEGFSVSVILFLCSQSNALISSLILIPFSIFFITSFMTLNYNSSMVLIVYIMIYIGGLLILLVSVASLSSNEQTLNLVKMELVFSLGILPFIIFSNSYQTSMSINTMMLWLENNSYSFLVVLVIILIGLMAISKNSVSFKGLVRML